MAHETALQSFNIAAGADLSEQQYRFIDVNSSGLAVVAGVGVLAAGVLQNDPVSGGAANVAHGGETKIVFGGTVEAGDDVAADANGAAVVAAGAGTYILGKATIGGAAGEVGSIVLKSAGPLAA